MSTDSAHTEEKEPGSFRLILTLGVAGFLSGLILVSVYLYTKPIIAQNRADALKAAVFEVLPGTSGFTAMAWDGNALVEVKEGQPLAGEMIYFGFDSAGAFTGVAIPGEESGYQDIISGLAGYHPDDKIIIGFKVLESKETPGLGDKIFLDEDFSTNFEKLSVEPEITVVKKGEKSADNQIEAITGATISSKAVGRLLQKSMETWKDRIAQYRQKNATKPSGNEGN